MAPGKDNPLATLSKGRADASKEMIPLLNTLYVYVAGCCNLRCRHCWIDPSTERGPDKFLSWERLKGIVEDALPLGLSAVKLTGGEPLLHPEFLEIVTGLKGLGLRVIVETNGTLLGPEEARVLKETKAFVSVSIDAPFPEMHDEFRGVKGAFEMAVEGAGYLKEQGIPFQLISCLYRANAHLLPKMAGFARELGAASMKINPINDVGRGREMAEKGELLTVREIIGLYRDSLSWPNNGVRVIFDVPPAFVPLRRLMGAQGFSTCGIFGILGVLHNGDAALCGIGAHVPEMNFGSLLGGDVREIWEGCEVLNLLRRELPHGLKGVCGRCILRAYCLGKCRAWAFWETGDVFAPLSFCQVACEEGLFPESRLES
jgi:SynChlorMet cassette radical SAM/SPASM protein ScmF